MTRRYETVSELVRGWNETHSVTTTLLVTHSHSHDDHVKGDSQFINKPNTICVGTNLDDI